MIKDIIIYSERSNTSDQGLNGNLSTYYEINNLITICAYAPSMSKKVISLRLSDSDLAKLDEACRRLGVNRSEALSAAIATLPAFYDERGALRERVPFLMNLAEEGADGENRS